MKMLKEEHGVVCRVTGTRLSYFGWPSVTRLDDGSLVAASSGLRSQHICPWGKTVLHFSSDEGKTWSPSRIINDSPLDDRDAGIICLGGRRVLVSWFTSDTRRAVDPDPRRATEWYKENWGEEEWALWQPTLESWTEETVKKWVGSWIMLSEDNGQTWSLPISVPFFTPHGPIRLASGEILYLGQSASNMADLEKGKIIAGRSADGGKTWVAAGTVPFHPGTGYGNYAEPHVVELPSGKLIGLIRTCFTQNEPEKGLINFSLFQTESEDGGRTWTPARPTGIYGCPPHLIRHSSGALVCVYGYREMPFGQRAMFSYDEGKTWDADWILRDDGPDWDLGYPCSAELPGGDIFTVYYQKFQAGEKPSLLWSRWKLP